MPMFSIIVPIYNIDQYVEECLKSILNQTYEDFECIMIDDGSKDNSGRICDAFEKMDMRFKCVHKKNGGLVSARKAGINVASGEYIINVDGDDFIDKDLLEKMYSIVSSYNPDLICFGMTTYNGRDIGTIINNCQQGLYRNEKLSKIKLSYLYDSDIKGINSGSVLFNICAKCVKRELYMISQEKVEDVVTSGEDTLFTLYLLSEISSMYCLNYVGYKYRITPTSIEHSFNEKCFDNLNVVVSNMKINQKLYKQKENNILVYFMYRFLRYVIIAGQTTKSYRDYKGIINRKITEENIHDLKNTKIINNSFNSWIKLFLIRNRCWLVIYLLSNTWFKGKMDL